jgi:hypothetical protein
LLSTRNINLNHTTNLAGSQSSLQPNIQESETDSTAKTYSKASILARSGEDDHLLSSLTFTLLKLFEAQDGEGKNIDILLTFMRWLPVSEGVQNSLT